MGYTSCFPGPAPLIWPHHCRLVTNGNVGQVPSRLLTKSASGVLATLRGSTYGREYASPLRLLRPCWTVFLNSLRMLLKESVSIRASCFCHAHEFINTLLVTMREVNEEIKILAVAIGNSR